MRRSILKTTAGRKKDVIYSKKKHQVRITFTRGKLYYLNLKYFLNSNLNTFYFILLHIPNLISCIECRECKKKFTFSNNFINNVKQHYCYVAVIKLEYKNINYDFSKEKVQCKLCASTFAKGNNLKSNLSIHYKSCKSTSKQSNIFGYFKASLAPTKQLLRKKMTQS
jgi:hypothetical protein